MSLLKLLTLKRHVTRLFGKELIDFPVCGQLNITFISLVCTCDQTFIHVGHYSFSESAQIEDFIYV